MPSKSNHKMGAGYALIENKKDNNWLPYPRRWLHTKSTPPAARKPPSNIEMITNGTSIFNC